MSGLALPPSKSAFNSLSFWTGDGLFFAGQIDSDPNSHEYGQSQGDQPNVHKEVLTLGSSSTTNTARQGPFKRCTAEKYSFLVILRSLRERPWSMS